MTELNLGQTWAQSKKLVELWHNKWAACQKEIEEVKRLSAMVSNHYSDIAKVNADLRETLNVIEEHSLAQADLLSAQQLEIALLKKELAEWREKSRY